MQNNQCGSLKITFTDPQPTKPANKTRHAITDFYCHIQRKQVDEPTHTDNSAAASLLPTIREEM